MLNINTFSIKKVRESEKEMCTEIWTIFIYLVTIYSVKKISYLTTVQTIQSNLLNGKYVRSFAQLGDLPGQLWHFVTRPALQYLNIL